MRIHALDIHKAHHWPCRPSYLDEAALDHVGGASIRAADTAHRRGDGLRAPAWAPLILLC